MKKFSINRILSLVFFSLSFLFFSFELFAATVTIPNAGVANTDTTLANPVDNNDSVVFSGASTGTLNINHTVTSTRNIASINTNTNTVGDIAFGTGDRRLLVSGQVGTSALRINNITLNNSSSLATFYDEINLTNGVLTATNGQGYVQFFGDPTNGSTYNVNSHVGSSTASLGVIEIGNKNFITFNGNIYTSTTALGTASTMNIANTGSNIVSLGAISSNPSAKFILNTNATGTTYDSSAGTAFAGFLDGTILKIANNKSLTLSGASNVRGYLDLGITYDAANPSYKSTANITVDNGLKLNFDYANATSLDVDSVIGAGYTLMQTTGTLTAAACTTTCSYSVTDNSILLTPIVSKVANTLVLSNQLDTSVTSALGKEEYDNMNFLLTDELGSTIRTEMLKISSLKTLEDDLDSLEEERNNMVQTTSLDISNKIRNVINYRTMALNYNYVGFSSGNNKKKQNGSLWGEVFGGMAKQDERLGEEGFSSTIGGVVFGGDGVVRSGEKDMILGLALSYANANVDGDSLSNQNTDISSYQATLYNNNVASNGMGLFNENSITFGYNQYDSSRRIQMGSIDRTADADYNGTQFMAQTGLGYNFKVMNKLFISPNIAARYSSLSLEDYTETGAGTYGLNVDNDTFDTVSSDLGVRIMGELETGKSNFNIYPQLNLSWTKNWDKDGREATTSFIGSSTKTKNVGVDLVENVFNAGAQFNIETSDSTDFVIKYDLQASKDYIGHLASVRYRISF